MSNLQGKIVRFYSLVGILALIISMVIILQIISFNPASSQTPSCFDFDSAAHKITISCGSFRISDLATNLANSTVIRSESSGIWTLDADLFVDTGGTVIIDSKDVKWLKINTPHGIDVLGNLVVDSVRITGWDPVTKTFAMTDGYKSRPFLNMEAGATGQMNITNSEIGYMGYLQDGRQGISYSGGSGSILANNNIHDMWFGFYSNNVKNITIEHNIVHDNVNYGLDPHSGSSNIIIRFNEVYNIEKNVGIICSYKCSNILIENNTVYNATSAGIMLNDFTTDSIIRNNHVYNSGVGISIFNNTQGTDVKNNIISNTQVGIKLEKSSFSNTISANSITKSKNSAICVDDTSKNNTISLNTIDSGSPTSCPAGLSTQFISSNIITGSQTFTPRIAMVSQSFTYAAYSIGHFYNFYEKYRFPPQGTLITTDLKMFTAPLPHGPFHFYNDPPEHENIIPGSDYFYDVHQYVAKALPGAKVDDLRDEDVHEGKIFDSDGSNMYDIIILFHQEYVTADEYYNLQTFVSNGGTLIFADANTFTVEVTYSKETDSVTLVKGHNWQYDGKVAQPGPGERWLDETSSWVGNNFLPDPTYIPITFKNMPFNSKHVEEQYISNPKDTVLMDYEARYPTNHRFNPIIGAHELVYGKGKIESLGFFASQDPGDPNLENFIENVILPRATGKIVTVHALDQTFPIRWIMQNSTISQISIDSNNTLNLKLDRQVKNDTTLRIVFPQNLLGDHPHDDLSITLDGQPVSFRHFTDNVETSFEIILPKEGSLLQISPVIPKPDLSGIIEAKRNSLQSTQYYSCELQYVDSFACDLLPNIVTAFQVRGDGAKIYSTNSVPIFSSGKKGSAVEFFESRFESLEVPYSKAITPSQFSVSLFIKPGESVRNYAVIASNVGTKQDSGWYFELAGGISKNVFFDIYLDHRIIRSHPIAISLNEFTHIAATYGDGKIRIYKNGELVETIIKNGYYDSPDSLLRIGGMTWSTNVFPLNGAVDEFYLYSRALQPDEIKSIYNNSNIPHDSSLVLYYPFDGDIKDHSGTGIDAIKPTLIASMAFAPDGSLFFTEKDTGNIRIMKNEKVIDEPFYHVSDIWSSFEQGLLGLAIDPKFEENHFVYFYYTYHDQSSNHFYNRVVRVTDVNNKGQDPVVILDKIYAIDGFHSGGAVAFGADDKLYITVGDATEHPFAMDPNIMIGKVLRINRDGSIPSDNPYPNSPVYNIGHRNMFGIAFDHNGFGIVTENGDSAFDEINDIQKGGNYGFPLVQPPNENPYLYNSSGSVMPLLAFHTTVAPTQAIYYDGNKFPSYHNQFLFGSFDTGIFALNMNANKTVTSYDRIFVHHDSAEPVIAIAESPSGDIYYGGYSIYKLQSVDNLKIRFLVTMEVNSDSEKVLFKEIKFIPAEKKMILIPAEGSQYLTTPLNIRMLVSITNAVDTIEDENGNKIKFTKELSSPYYYLDIFVNFDETNSNTK